MAKIAVLTSGGVDSSVALYRLAEDDAHDLTAFYLKIWLEDEMAFLGSCPWQEDFDLIRQICERIRVPLEIVSLQRQYFDTVIAYTLDELRRGHTPSPDVVCNRSIKFAAFIDRIDPSFELVATGHYARTRQRAALVHLLRSIDPIKDQTYFLSQLTQKQVARCLFPIGTLDKSQVRSEARRMRLPNWNRPDSQGICFLGRVPYDDFIGFHLGHLTGDIVEHATGRILGPHPGHWFFTVGQRRGLGLAGGPWYVVAKDAEANRVEVVHARELADHHRRSFLVLEPNWIANPPIPSKLLVRIRHGERLIPCTVRPIQGRSVEVILDQGDPGVAPGQFAVLYDDEECLGGGAISLG